jgi:hypothetical protein
MFKRLSRWRSGRDIESPDLVDALHSKALALGGTSEGDPGHVQAWMKEDHKRYYPTAVFIALHALSRYCIRLSKRTPTAICARANSHAKFP